MWHFVPSTHFDLYQVVMKKVYTKADKYSKFCQMSISRVYLHDDDFVAAKM